jgi:membrane protease YdiL (CAAX protease family)
MDKLKISFPILLVIIYTGLMLWAGHRQKAATLFNISKNTYINFQINYQSLLLLITAIALLFTYLLNKENFISYFSFGNISAPAQELKIFGIKSTDTWLQTGISLSVVISIVTGIFMYFQLKQHPVNWSLLSSGLLWIILFSLTNSFAEEMIFRMGIVSPLKGLVSPLLIYTISAVLFGIPHFAGMPNGIIGATMAGVLGFVLAKSLHETNGFFWAWFIHFLQDVIIIGSLFLMKNE